MWNCNKTFIKLGKVFFIFFRAISFFFEKTFYTPEKFARVKIVFHTSETSCKARKEQKADQRESGLVSIFDSKCGSRAQMLLFPVQLTKGLWIKNVCAFFSVPSTNSRDQRHGRGKAAQKKTAFATIHKTIWLESEWWWEKLWDTFLLPFNNLN